MSCAAAVASSRVSFISKVSSVRKICAAREGVEQQLRSPFFRFPSKPPFLRWYVYCMEVGSQLTGSMCVLSRNEAKILKQQSNCDRRMFDENESIVSNMRSRR